MFICDGCIPTVRRVSDGASHDQFRVGRDKATQCRFCGKKERRVDWVVVAPDRGGASVCNECLSLIEEILGEEDGGAPVPSRA